MSEPTKGTNPRRGRVVGWAAREISREQLVPLIAQQTGMTYQAVDLVLNALLEKIKQTVVGGKAVQFRGFGRWWLQQMNPKRMPPNRHNPNGMQMPARKKIRFRPSPHFQQLLPGWTKSARQALADAARAAKPDRRLKINRLPVEDPK